MGDMGKTESASTSNSDVTDEQAILNHLRWINRQMEEQQQERTQLLREMRRTRRAVASVWFAELLSPVLAIVMLASLTYFGVKFAEKNYLGGMDVFAKAHETLQTIGAKITEQEQISSQESKQ